MRPTIHRDLVLVGGGHSNVQVLKMLAMKAPRDVQLTVISDSSYAYYSGMFPGLVAGLYTEDEIRMELRPLCRWAGARFVHARVVDVDPEAREVLCEGHPPVRFDLCAMNVGSATRHTDLPGVAEHAVATRPISRLYGQIVAFEEGYDRGGKGPRVVVVGGGAAGVELAFTLGARFRRRWSDTVVSLVDTRRTPLEERGSWVSRVVHEELTRRSIHLQAGARAVKATKDALHLEGGKQLPFDMLVFATGGAAHPFMKSSRLETDEAGFLKVDECLRSLSSPRIFGAGDCIRFAGQDLPKAGVYAVREGPVLTENLLRVLEGREPRPYRPQSGFLALLATGDGRGILSWRGLAARGEWVWRLKDWIDVGFMRKFDVAHMGESPAMMRAMKPPEETPEAMRCAGCGAKVGGAALKEALAGLDLPENPRVRVGLAEADDGAVVEVPAGKLQVQTVDAFPAFLDDGYVIGRIAAVHAASDLFAMGATPETALLTLTIPESHPRRTGAELRTVLAGVIEELGRMGASLVGGHTTEGEELIVGLAMTGLVDEGDLLAKGGLAPGDKLLLTKGLGTGTLLAADMRMQAKGAWVDGAVASMLLSNESAARLAGEHGVRALTDVTGFGLAGHLGEMLRASGLSATLTLVDLPLLDGAEECFERGIFSTLDPDNRVAVNDLGLGIGGGAREAVLYDPQTSGGLLMGVEAELAGGLLAKLHESGYGAAAIIGEVTDGAPAISLV